VSPQQVGVAVLAHAFLVEHHHAALFLGAVAADRGQHPPSPPFAVLGAGMQLGQVGLAPAVRRRDRDHALAYLGRRRRAARHLVKPGVHAFGHSPLAHCMTSTHLRR
jgi:hypothetical protein